jgi:8-oxo-dGTP pyrophosphatase MutT (NUDIX family)
MKYGNMAYIVSKGKVLMIKKVVRENDPNSGYFTLPGGKIKFEEKGLNNIFGRRESAIRETLEETGIRMLNPVLQGIILFDNSQRTFSDWKNPDNFLVYIYSSKKFSGKIKASDEGVPYSVPLEKLEEVPSNSGDKLMYGWLKDGRKFFGVIYHKGNEVDEVNSWVDFY